MPAKDHAGAFNEADHRLPECVAGARLSRRRFLTLTGTSAAALSSSGLLAACSARSPSASGAGKGSGPGGLPIARPNHPVTLPLHADNKAIPAGLKPERGPLQVYNWADDLNPKTITDFEQKYGVKVEYSSFATLDEAIAKISSRAVQFDIFYPELTVLEPLVAGKLLQPVNLSYIPNISNVWPSLRNPWYDRGSHYTVPYTVYTTGLAWRADKLPGFSPSRLPNPWSTLWAKGPSLSGKVALLDDEREGLVMGLLHNGVTDVNTGDTKLLNAAKNSIIDLVNKTNLKFNTNEYQTLTDGSIWLQQAWNGDIAAAPAYLPKGTPPSVLRYWWPSNGHGPINNETIAVLNGAKNPVLAHLWINHFLDPAEAFKHFAFTGYQIALTALTPEAIVARGLVPPNLKSTLVRANQFAGGYIEAPLTRAEQVLWQNEWAAVKSG